MSVNCVDQLLFKEDADGTIMSMTHGAATFTPMFSDETGRVCWRISTDRHHFDVYVSPKGNSLKVYTSAGVKVCDE